MASAGVSERIAGDAFRRVPDCAVVREELAAVDWDFVEREPAHIVDSIHPYPARFIGDLPRTLMRLLPCPEGSRVLDPFAGCGTTMLEAQRLGLPSIGVDINPVACLVARVKTAPSPAGLTERAQDVARVAAQSREACIPDIPNVDHWFEADVQVAVAALLNEIEKVDDAGLKDALRLALSSILVRVSNQDSDTRYAAIEKNVCRDDVFAGFLAAAGKLDHALSAREWPRSPVEVLNADTLALGADDIGGPVGLVVTSPPYPNAYEYWLYHKYRMWWLGYDPLAVKQKEIGARAHFFKRDPHTEEHFRLQMRQTFSLVADVLHADGYVCFVIGRSRIHGKIVDNASIIREVAGTHGFGVAGEFERTVAPRRKSFNLAYANIKTETVLVMRRH